MYTCHSTVTCSLSEALNIIMACPQCRRKVRQSHFCETVRQSHFSATVWTGLKPTPVVHARPASEAIRTESRHWWEVRYLLAADSCQAFRSQHRGSCKSRCLNSINYTNSVYGFAQKPACRMKEMLLSSMRESLQGAAPGWLCTAEQQIPSPCWHY